MAPYRTTFAARFEATGLIYGVGCWVMEMTQPRAPRTIVRRHGPGPRLRDPAPLQSL